LLFDPTLHFGLAALLVPFAASWSPAAVAAGVVAGLLVPFAAPWSPAAVAAGVVAGWAMLAIASSFRLKRWIGQKGWRRLHYLSFGAFVLALGHALVAGTDLHGVGGPILAAIAAGPVIWLVLARILLPRSASAAPPRPELEAAGR
jgi:predicted ferric reductase